MPTNNTASISATSPPSVHNTLMNDKPPYSIFTAKEKWSIVTMCAFAGLFSPLTANIYLPAIPTISAAFHKSTELINLTVTVYLVFQGVSPMFWGTIADRWGRRPMFLSCLLLLALSCVGLALVPTSAYWLLMLLRCVQAAGSASTIALGAGVIGDIATRAERGGFFGFWSLGPMIGPAIGPVIGGALSDALGWRSIFWCLCIASAVCLLCMFLFLPETLRILVGDGSITPPAIYRPLIPIIGRDRLQAASTEKPPQRPMSNPLRIFLNLDVVVLLVFTGIIYAVFYGVLTTISSSFKEIYSFLSDTSIGLCFLAVGGGMLLSSALTGKLLDWDYSRIEKQLSAAAAADPEKKILPEDVTKDEIFPIERARLRTMPVYLAIFVACCIGHGWCIDKQVNIAGPLILEIVIGYTFIAITNTTQTLLVDLMPDQGSSITACNNLVRCSLAAILVSVIDLIVNGLSAGWTYVLLGGVCLLIGPTLALQMHIGPKWRARRRAQKAVQGSSSPAAA